MCALTRPLLPAALLILLLSATPATSQFWLPLLTIPARLPPGTPSSTPQPSFHAPPSSFYTGNWHVTRTSSLAYQGLRNMQFDSYPVLPTCEGASPATCEQGTFPGQMVDLVSYTLPGDSRVWTAFGYDTPRRLNDGGAGEEWEGAYDFLGAGRFNATNTWIVLSYGWDELGIPFTALYETAVELSGFPPALNIESRSPTGPAPLALVAIQQRLRGLGDDDLTALVDALEPVLNDGARDGLGQVICDERCRTNADLVEGGAVGRAF